MGMRPLNYEGYIVVTSNETIILNANLGDRLQATEVNFRAFRLPCKPINCRHSNKATNNGVIVTLRSELYSC